MTLSDNFNTFKNHFNLVRTKIFDVGNLKWFFLSIITISTLFTVSTSFLLGFQNQQLFTDSTEPNTLIISQPKITPAQSQVPLFWINDIQQLKGITVVSPETVDLVIDQSNGQTPYFRGVTPNFKEFFSSFKMISGEYFQENTTQNQIIVGKNYAQLFHIKVGDNLVLQSRTKTAVIDVQVAGIFNTNSIADDGLVGPLWMGRLFGGLSDNLVNIIRIKFDPTLYTKTQLQSIILDQHTIRVVVTNPYKYNASISKSTIQLFNRYKEQINQTTVDSAGQAFFTVPFGKYYVKLSNPGISKSSFTAIFVQKYLSINVILGTQFASFSAQFTISGETKANASVNILNLDTNDWYNTTTNAMGNISASLPLGSLKISFKWKNYQNTTVVNHQKAETLTINFDYAIMVFLRDSETNTTLANTPVTIINLETNKNITTSTNANGFIIENLQPGTPYKLISHNSFFTRTYTLSYFNQSTFNLYTGRKTVTITVKDIDIGTLNNYKVNVSIRNPVTEEISNSVMVTSSTGVFSLDTYAGFIITLKTFYAPVNKTFIRSITVENIPRYTFYVGKQEFFVSIAQTSSASDLFPSTVVLTNLQTTENFNFGLNSNVTQKLFLNYGNYSIYASSPKYTSYNQFNFNSLTNNKFVINYKTYAFDATFLTRNGSTFKGDFILSTLRNNNYQTIRESITSKLDLHLQNGNYKITLDNTRYTFETLFTIHSQDSYQTFFVTEKSPEINPINFGNYSIVNSSTTFFLSSLYTKQLTYYWNTNQSQLYNSLTGIKTPSLEGTYVLTVQGSNYDNTTVTNKYTIRIDNTGPIASLLNAKGNNSWVDYSYIPQFSFSETPKSVLYTWDANQTTSNPVAIPLVNGTHKLRVEVEDFANNTNVFYYLFYFDNKKPELLSSNPLNNSIITSSAIDLTFSEQLSYIDYSWNGANFRVIQGTNQIPVPATDGLTYNLTIYFVDLAGNSNQTTLSFPIVDQYKPIFTIPSNYWNITFNQSFDAFIPFYTANTNNTVFYRWNTSLPWNILYINDNYNYSLAVPNQNGSLQLEVKVYDKYNPSDLQFSTFLFTGNFYYPQFNVSIEKPLGPAQVISIGFPADYANWSIYWDSLLYNSSSMLSTSLNISTSLGYHNLTIQGFSSVSNQYITNIYNLSIQNIAPHLANSNLTYLSSYNTYTLMFPAYVSNWNYSWPSGSIQTGTILNTTLYIPNSLNGLNNLTITYSTKYGISSTFSLPFTLDSIKPQIYLVTAINRSYQKAGFNPSIQISEKFKQVLYSWDNTANSTILYPMPKYPSNTQINLTIYVEDYANNWNKTTYSFIEVSNLFNITLDLAKSQITNGFVKSGNILVFNVSSLNGISKITCSWNNQAEEPCSTNVTVKYFQGTFSLTIRVYDKAGNVGYLIQTLQSDYAPPVLTKINLQNNTVINSYFVLHYNFSETVSSSNSIYSWGSYTNSTGFPIFNNSLIGFQTLNWWFSDLQGNWNHYIFTIFVDRIIPSFSIAGNYSSSVIIANSTLSLSATDQISSPLDIYTQWNNGPQSYDQVNPNSKLTIVLPNGIGAQTLHVMVKDQYNNWNNKTIHFIIKLFFSVQLTDSQNKPISQTTLELQNLVNSTIVAWTNTTSSLNLFLTPATYLLTVSFAGYNLSSTISIGSSSFNKRISLIQIIVGFNGNKTNNSNPVSGTLSWHDDFLASTMVNVTSSRQIYVSQDNTDFQAEINNTLLKQTLQIYQANTLVNFTLLPSTLAIKVISELNHLPISNVQIKIGKSSLGFTNKDGILSVILDPGSYTLQIVYNSFTANLSVQLFENQFQTVNLPISSNISILIQNSDNSPVDNVPVFISTLTTENLYIGITNFNGFVRFNNIPWGIYRIGVKYANSTLVYNITVGDSLALQNNIFTITLPNSNNLDNLIGNNLGKWTFNRNYELSNPSALSDQTVQNLGFSVIFLTLFLIILVMTFLGLISVQHQPIYKLKNSIKNLHIIGSSRNQVLEIITFQFTVWTIILTSLGYFIASILILFWPNLQEFPIAGMIIRPENFNSFMFLLQNVGFGLITGFYSYYYTKKEYFSPKVNELEN